MFWALKLHYLLILACPFLLKIQICTDKSCQQVDINEKRSVTGQVKKWLSGKILYCTYYGCWHISIVLRGKNKVLSPRYFPVHLFVIAWLPVQAINGMTSVYLTEQSWEECKMQNEDNSSYHELNKCFFGY